MARHAAVHFLASLALLVPPFGASALQLQLLSGQPAGGTLVQQGQHRGLLQSLAAHDLGLFQATHVTVAPTLDRANGTGPFVTVAYYKTGCVVARELHWLLFNVDASSPQFVHAVDYFNGSTPEEWPDDRFSAGRFWSERVDLVPWSFVRRSYHVEFPTDGWPVPSGARVVHWVRDPIKQIVSAYRYNAKESMESTYPEMFMVTPGKCGWCDAISHHAIFELCNYTCTYHALLNALPEESGALVEATHMSAVLKVIAGNTERWANNPDVLFLSNEQLSLDFNQTMDCMIEFAEIPREPFLMDKLQLANVEVTGSDHMTEGHYDNTELEAFLEAQPFLKGPVAALRSTLTKIYERQHRMYGCPVPEL